MQVCIQERRTTELPSLKNYNLQSPVVMEKHVLKFLLCIGLCGGVLTPSLSVLAAPVEPGLLIEHNVPMKTRDGVNLRADIYRPTGDGPFAVLLQRTPYDKSNAAPFAQKAVARGYMVVVQDVRGRYASEGEWYPFKHESDDG